MWYVLAGALASAAPVQSAHEAAESNGRLWVYFDGRAMSAPQEQAALRALAATYGDRALERRRARRALPGLVDASDLPVAPAFVHAVEETGARVHVESRWLNAVSVRATPAQASALRALPFVTRVEPVRGGRAVRAPIGPAGDAPLRGVYGYAEGQLTQIGVPELHARGFTGRGIVIAVLDTGFVRSHQVFRNPDRPLRVLAEHDFVMGDGNTAIEPGDHPEQHIHGTLILGTLAGYLPGTFVGAAYDAEYVLCKTEDYANEVQVEEDNYVAGLEFAEQHGADVATSSLGYIDWYTPGQLDGQTAVTTRAVNIATANGLYCCTAAGNQGYDGDPATNHLIAPADALQVLTVGAVDAGGANAWFTSDGPSADGRVKPELLAQGVDTITIAPWDDGGYVAASGTSLSTPLIAGAVACLVQARPYWSVDRLRDRLLATGRDFVQDGRPDPMFVRGYGLADAPAALDTDCAPDFTGDGGVDSDDFFDFLNAFFADDGRADFTGDGVLDSDDFFEFLNAFFLGC